MPAMTFPITSAALEVPVLIGLDGRTTAALHNAGRPITPPVSARALLDTCSDITAIASPILRQLGLRAVNTVTTHTATGAVSVSLFEVSLSFKWPGLAGPLLFTQADLIATELAAALPDADVLIGLDLLLQGKLSVDGPGRRFTLEF